MSTDTPAAAAAAAAAEEDQSISTRAAKARSNVVFHRKHHGLVFQNHYDAKVNPTGIVNLGIAENSLCEDLWQKKFSEPQMLKYQTYMHYYFRYSGLARECVAQFMSKWFKAKQTLSADNIVITSGCGAAMDYASYCLTDPDDYLLVFTPCYYAIPYDIGFRQGARMLQVPLPLDDREDALAYEQNVRDLSAVYKQAIAEGKKVKGLLLVNPHNPTGNIVRREKLAEMVDFCIQHKLHVISNEIYALSCFAEGSKFDSVLSLDNLPDPQRLHVLWGFSKDFAISGFRCGVVYSGNDLITRDRGALEQYFYFGSVPALIQEQLRLIITDTDWLHAVYLPTNLRRMDEAHILLEKKLKDDGIPVYPAKAGFFIWANFRKYLPEPTEEAEMDLFRKFFEAGVYVIPGMKQFCAEPGWFRLTFTCESHLAELGFLRMSAVLQSLKH